jgi:hypothetical protein
MLLQIYEDSTRDARARLHHVRELLARHGLSVLDSLGIDSIRRKAAPGDSLAKWAIEELFDSEIRDTTSLLFVNVSGLGRRFGIPMDSVVAVTRQYSVWIKRKHRDRDHGFIVGAVAFATERDGVRAKLEDYFLHYYNLSNDGLDEVEIRGELIPAMRRWQRVMRQ